SSIDLATSILYACRGPDSPSKSRRTCRPVTRRPLWRTASTAAVSPLGWPTRSRAESMIWVKPASLTARSLASIGPASVIVSMPKSSSFTARPSTRRSRRGAHHEFDAESAEINLRERTLCRWLHWLTIDEDDAASLQRAHRRQHIGCTETHTQQRFVPFDEIRPGRRFDQLEIETAVGTLQQRALGQHSEILPAPQCFESEQRAIEIDPVGAAIRLHRLHESEPVQAGDRRWVAIRAGNGHEVDVVDRQPVMAFDEIDQAVAHAVDSRDVQLHRSGARRHVPRAQLQSPAMR